MQHPFADGQFSQLIKGEHKIKNRASFYGNSDTEIQYDDLVTFRIAGPLWGESRRHMWAPFIEPGNTVPLWLLWC